VRHLLGQHEAAVSCYRQAAAIFAECGAVCYRAEVVINLGDVHDAAGDRQEARKLWQEALEVFEQAHHPGTERLRAKIQGSRIKTA
jgi:tetratricopeptide (TPR) repeat protein